MNKLLDNIQIRIAKRKINREYQKKIKYFGKHYIKPIIHKKANLNI